MRYPAPSEDDPEHPAVTVAAIIGLPGPDLHGHLQPIDDSDEDVAVGDARHRGVADEVADGVAGSPQKAWLGASSLLRQLRQRALTGSSSDDEMEQRGEREWQSLVRSLAEEEGCATEKTPQ